MRKISLKEKLVVYFVSIGLLGLLVVSVFAYYDSRNALLSRTFDQLTSVRVNKSRQVEVFFNNRMRDAALMASGKQIRDLSTAFFGKNPDQISGKQSLLLQSSLFSFLKKSGYYYQLALVDSTGRYMMFALRDEADNTGNNTQATYGSITGNLLSDIFKDEVRIHDTSILELSSWPALSVSSPVPGFMGKTALVLDIIPAEFNRIMLENNPREGLGESGESYIVGPDRLMRSPSRFHPDTLLQTTVETDGVYFSQNDSTGHGIFEDYRGVSVLSSFSPLHVPGLNWVILAEIDHTEAMAPIFALLSRLLLLCLLNLIVIFGFSYLLARRITLPLVKLNRAALNVGSQQPDIVLPVASNDEIGELTRAFNDMIGRLKVQSEALANERKMRVQSMIDGQENERRRFSRDLHDYLGQSLIAIRLQLESLCETFSGEKRLKLKKIKQYFDQVIDDVRQMSNDLAPSVLDEFGLTTALRNLCEQRADQCKLKISFTSQGVGKNISQKTKIYVYRICQEALSNAIRHAKARQISLLIEYEEQQLKLTVKDDGCGFDMNIDEAYTGNGLHNMEERARLLGGFFQIISSPDNGTRIRFECKI